MFLEFNVVKIDDIVQRRNKKMLNLSADIAVYLFTEQK